MGTFTSIADIAQHVARRAPRVIGIAGSPGAGKSTVAAELVALLPGAALLPMDGYHLPQARLVELGRRDRMGAPDTFDVEAFIETLKAVRAERWPVIAPGFDRDIEEPVADAITIGADIRTIVVEGNYLLLDSGGWEAAAPLIDETFFVEIERTTRLARLIERHIRFGKNEADARAWALGPDEANARAIEGTARHADHRIRLP